MGEGRVSNKSISEDVKIAFEDAIWSRRLITTKRGYFGLAPADTRRGDVLILLFGCPVPAVLRK